MNNVKIENFLIQYIKNLIHISVYLIILNSYSIWKFVSIYISWEITVWKKGCFNASSTLILYLGCKHNNFVNKSSAFSSKPSILIIYFHFTGFVAETDGNFKS